MKKQRVLLRAVSVAAAMSLLLCAASCEESSGTKRPVNIPSSYSSEAESQQELPPFVDTDIDESYNLAKLGAAFADSVSGDYPTYTADKLNDGDLLTRWLSEYAGTEDEPSSFGIEWESPVTFDVVILYWDAAHPAEGGFTVEIDAEKGAARDGMSAEESEELPYVIVRRGTEKDDGQTDVIVFNEPVSVSSLRITCNEPYYSEEHDLAKDTPSCYEIEVYYSEDVEGDDISAEYGSENVSSSDVTVEW